MITKHRSVNGVAYAAVSLDWEHRRCTNQTCSGGTWVVKRAPLLSNLWWVAQAPDQSLSLVAASDPICPRCGAALAAALAPQSELSLSRLGGSPIRRIRPFRSGGKR
jgi:hypothetical protein